MRAEFAASKVERRRGLSCVTELEPVMLTQGRRSGVSVSVSVSVSSVHGRRSGVSVSSVQGRDLVLVLVLVLVFV